MSSNVSFPNSSENLEEAIVDLYLEIKLQTQDQDLDKEEYSIEKEKLMSIDPFVVVEYIWSTIEILLKLKAEEIGEKMKSKSRTTQEHSTPNASITSFNDVVLDTPSKGYEEMLVKLETDIRNHIRVSSLHSNFVDWTINEVAHWKCSTKAWRHWKYDVRNVGWT